LGSLPNVRLYEPPPSAGRHPTIAFTVEGYAPRDVAQRLSDRDAIFVSHGNFYAATAIAKLVAAPHEGVVRAGLAIYSTPDEARRLVEAVAAVR
jgi:selenocysteine lyase/cysteine desulfurase